MLAADIPGNVSAARAFERLHQASALRHDDRFVTGTRKRLCDFQRSLLDATALHRGENLHDLQRSSQPCHRAAV